MRSLFVAGLISTVTAGVAFAQPGATARREAPTIPAISDAVRPFIDQGEVAGAVMLVARDGRIVHLDAIGYSDLEAQRPMRRNSLFAIASMTKPIVATGVMILQDEGKLSIDDKVSKYLPAFADAKLRGGDAPAREITIRDVLTHTSGLGGSQVFSGSLAEAADELARRPLDFQPGTKWQYSPGITVAGRIIEVVANKPLQDLLQERIFDPLRMNNTTFFLDDMHATRLATIYAKNDDSGTLERAENFIGDPTAAKAPNPSGGLVSSARDLFKFYRMIANGGEWRGTQVVLADAVRAMTTVQTGDLKTGFTPGNGWGLGWCVVREPQGVTAMLSRGSFGHGGAFGTQGWIDPNTKTIYVLLVQRSNFRNSDDSDLRKAFQAAAAAAL